MQPSSPMHTGQTSQAQRIIYGLARLWHGCRHQGCHALHRAESRASMLRQRPLIGVLIGLLGGSLLGAHLPLSPQLIGALLAVTGLVLCPWPSTQLQRACRLLLAGLLLTHGSMAWHHRALPLNHIAYVLPASSRQHLTVEGRVERPVESYHDRQRLYLRLHRLQDTQGWRVVSGRARLSIHATELSFLPGDTVRVTRLRLHRVRGFRNPGGFDFQRFMQRQDIYVIGGVSNPKRLSLRHRPQGWSLARRLERWRRNLRALVRAHLPTPYDAVLLAMILGQRGALPADLQDHFRATGTAHLLVVSGLHVGFLTAALLLGLRAFLRLVRSWIPRTWLPAWRPTPLAVLLCLPSVLLYCSLVGWKVSTVRAALMVGSYLLALILSRPRDLMHALCLAAALILLLQPRTLFGLGFQLSFVAVSALILVGQRHWWHDEAPHLIRRWRRRLWASTLGSSAAYLGTLPIIVGAFHTIPTYGVLANLLLLPLSSVIVPAGVVALGLTTAWPVLGSTVFTPLLPLLSWITTLVRFVAGLPGAQLHVAALSTPALLGYYGLCLGWVVPWRARWRLACAGLGAVLLLGGIGWHYVATRPRQLRVTFLDVGTGDAILVQVPGRHYVLIDGGGTYDGRFDIGAQVIAPFLWQHHIRRFDLMALTHTHADHARGLASVFQLFPTQRLLTNGSPLTAPYLRDLLVAGERWGTQFHTAQDGPQQWRWERLQLTVLSPPSAKAQGAAAWQPPTANDRSLVLRLQYGTVRLLLTGDIQHATERWLLRHGKALRADILQVPHHGSRTSTLPAFIRRVRPQVGVISVGAGNPYGHPHPEVLRTLKQHRVSLYRTDTHGAITITSDGNQYRILPFRPYRPPFSVRIPSKS